MGFVLGRVTERYMQLLDAVTDEVTCEDPSWDHYPAGVHRDSLHIASWRNGPTRIMYLWRITLPGIWSSGRLTAAPVVGHPKAMFVYSEMADAEGDISEGRLELARIAREAARRLQREELEAEEKSDG